MNKKLASDIVKRKLVLRQESVAVLTLPQLHLVGGAQLGGSGFFPPCGGTDRPPGTADA
jgi:hypothetical protein